MRLLERRFRDSLIRGALLPAGGLVVVGVSGGPDSSALLLLLQQFAAELGYSCEAAYFDHEIRTADERSAELQTVRRLVDSQGVALHVGNAPVPARARVGKRSLEEQARLDRYAFLADVAASRGASAVAVGHTADDQAETILLHIIRGAGLRGLAGMPASQPWPHGEGPRLVRPLLDFRRIETAEYYRDAAFVPHEDSQNRSLRYQRNRIRLKLLPMMEQLNPRVVEALVRLGQSARDQVEWMARLSDMDAGSSSRATSSLAETAPALRNEIIAQSFAVAAGSRRGLSARHLAALSALVDAGGEHLLYLPAGVVARVRAGTLRFEPRVTIPDEQHYSPDLSPMPFSVPGSVQFGGWEIRAEPVPAGVPRIDDRLMAVINACDAADLTVRAWRPGDRMRPSGMAGHKKLQDLFVDAKISRSDRASTPLVCIGEEIIWAVGIRAAARATVRDAKVQRVVLIARQLDDAAEGTIA